MTHSISARNRRRLTKRTNLYKVRNEKPFNKINLNKTNNNHMSQEDLIDKLRKVALEFCDQHGIPDRRANRAAKKAAREIMGKYYKESVHPPTTATAIWSERDLSDPDSEDPTRFLEKYWGVYLDEDVLDQSTLRRLDISLFDAIKSWCRNRNMDPQEHLPPPARKQTRPPRPTTVSRGQPKSHNYLDPAQMGLV